MKAAKLNLDRVHVIRKANDHHRYIQSTIKQAAQFLLDPEKKQRLAEQECMWCWYGSGRIGGSAMTTRPCAFCEKEMMHGSTCVDAACIDCARLHELCKHCGGDIGTRINRRSFKF